MDSTRLPGQVLEIITPYLANGADELQGGGDVAPLADLELSLHKRSEGSYSVEMRYLPPGSQVETRLGSDHPIDIMIDEKQLGELGLAYDWVNYGRYLGKFLFEPEALKVAFGQALARASGNGMRLRLLIGPTASELHSLYWETLRNPLDGTLLAGDQNILFSRYLASAGFRELKLRPKTTSRILIAAANPQGLESFGLSPIDVNAEVRRVQESLKKAGISRAAQVSVLTSENGGCTLANLVGRLQEGIDILYLVAHGSFGRGQAWLWLEDEDGQTRRVPGADLAAEMRLLESPPLLTYLASCESAGKGTGEALQAFGPQLCEAGLPAVVAMQGQISMASVARGMPVFFERLFQNGQVDRAMASSRAILAGAGAADFWMPVLFMRLKDGVIWQQPEGGAPAAVIQLWQMIASRFDERPAAQGALEELVADVQDLDNQEAFSIQLKKTLREDPLFEKQLSKMIEEIQHQSNSQKAGGINIQVGGDVGGNIVIGNQNTIEQRSK